MVAPTVIGHEDKKLGIILMYIGAPETEDFRGQNSWIVHRSSWNC